VTGAARELRPPPAPILYVMTVPDRQDPRLLRTPSSDRWVPAGPALRSAWRHRPRGSCKMSCAIKFSGKVAEKRQYPGIVPTAWAHSSREGICMMGHQKADRRATRE